MNCNSNTAPLINNMNSSCNSGCAPKDINIICKEIIIPNGQEVLGIQGENNSATRYFLVPKINENGDDLSNKDFSFIITKKDNSILIINVIDKKILDNYIKLKLIINKDITEETGIIKLSIQATSEDYIWKTYSANFKIAVS